MKRRKLDTIEVIAFTFMIIGGLVFIIFLLILSKDYSLALFTGRHVLNDSYLYGHKNFKVALAENGLKTGLKTSRFATTKCCLPA